MAEPPTPRSPLATPRTGDRIRTARSDRGISLRAFARQIGVSPATLSATENGHTGISVERLETIATALDLPPAALLGGGEDGRERDIVRPPRRAPDVSSVDAADPDRWREYHGAEVDDPVLAAALACIVDRGYHGSSIRDIAERAGLSIAALYHHHSSKQAMLVGLFDLAMNELLDRVVRARADGRGDPVRAFALMTESLVLYHSRRRQLSFLAATEMRSLLEPDRRRIADRRVALQRLFDTEVEHGSARGVFHVASAREAARAVVGLCIAVADWFDPGGESTPEQLAATYAGYALHLVGHSDSAS